MAVVFGLPIPDGYEIPFILTLIILLVKLILCIFLSYKVAKKRKEENVVAIQFLSGVLFLMLVLFLSRILYMIFDFFLTKFVQVTYPIFPNIWYWKTASLISAYGIGVLLLIIDRRILQFKFKGIFAIIVFAAATFQFFYPVSTTDDFQFVSTIGVVGSMAMLVIPILFFWIGAKTPGLRKIAFSVAFGAIIYAVGGSLVSATFINIFIGVGLTQDMVYAISIGMKAVGLVLITYGATHFSI
nr:hypothetical protein [Candidatus Sigynarchaeota archaeon]